MIRRLRGLLVALLSAPAPETEPVHRPLGHVVEGPADLYTRPQPTMLVAVDPGSVSVVLAERQESGALRIIEPAALPDEPRRCVEPGCRYDALQLRPGHDDQCLQHVRPR